MSHRQLAARLEELSEEHSLHSLTPHPSSLLCEIEQSMEQEEQEQEREQVVMYMTAGLCFTESRLTLFKVAVSNRQAGH